MAGAPGQLPPRSTAGLSEERGGKRRVVSRLYKAEAAPLAMPAPPPPDDSRAIAHYACVLLMKCLFRRLIFAERAGAAASACASSAFYRQKA